MPRGVCLTWPADYAYGYNGSYRRGLPQPIDRPSACVLKVWWAVARTHLISLQTVNSPYLCPTRWWRTACMVGHYIRVTPGSFCCHQVYSVVKRDLSQCSSSSTRAPHWQFLLENRDEKSSGSGSQNQGKLTFHASTQSSGRRPARLPTTSMAVTDPLMSNDHTVLSECLLKIDT